MSWFTTDSTLQVFLEVADKGWGRCQGEHLSTNWSVPLCVEDVVSVCFGEQVRV